MRSLIILNFIIFYVYLNCVKLLFKLADFCIHVTAMVSKTIIMINWWSSLHIYVDFSQ